MWTVHNVLPHDAILHDIQTELRMKLVEQCDVIHVMNKETNSMADAFFSIPEDKTIHIPHPTYEGYYPNLTTKNESRFNLNLSNDAFVFLFFGSIQAYKGLGDLVRAFKKLESQEDKELHLLIAGNVTNASHFKGIQKEISDSPHITLIQKRIPIEDVQYYFIASDYCVCPYRITLNSGVAHLSHSFGIPVIGPDIGGFSELLNLGGGLLFDPMDVESLYQSMKKALKVDSREIGAEIQELNIQYHPRKISAEFREKVIDALGWRKD
jgi:glycosyltransferase involved in cell wall biosynthesis